MKTMKPIYSTGLLVVALYGLTSFNPLNYHNHLASLEDQSLDLALETAEPKAPAEMAPLSGMVAEIAAKPLEISDEGTSQVRETFQSTAYRKEGDSISLRQGQKGIEFNIEGSVAEIQKFTKMGDATLIEYKLKPSSKLLTQAQSCRDCQDLLVQSKVIEIEGDISPESLNRNILSKLISDQILELENEVLQIASEPEACIDLDYRDGYACFQNQFAQAEKCERSSSRRSSRTRGASLNTNCSIFEMEALVEDFKTWASAMLTEEKVSIARLERLKNLTRNQTAQDHIDLLIDFETKNQEWIAYNSTFRRELGSLNDQLLRIDSQMSGLPQGHPQLQALAIERKKLEIDFSAYAQKYQRYFSSAFDPSLNSKIPGASSHLRDVTDSYAKIISPYRNFISDTSLHSLSLEPKLEIAKPSSTPGSSVDSTATSIAHLTDARHQRGGLLGADTQGFFNNFQTQSTYNSMDPNLTQITQIRGGARSGMNGPSNIQAWRNGQSGSQLGQYSVAPQFQQPQMYQQNNFQTSPQPWVQQNSFVQQQPTWGQQNQPWLAQPQQNSWRDF